MLLELHNLQFIETETALTAFMMSEAEKIQQGLNIAFSLQPKLVESKLVLLMEIFTYCQIELNLTFFMHHIDYHSS